MFVENIELKNFRNYKEEKIEVCPGANVFYGNNAQGKTNILEAIYLCTFGKSFRPVKDDEMVSYGENKYEIKENIKDTKRSYTIDINYDKEINRKTISINERNIKKYSDLIGYLNCVLFFPEDILMVKEGPNIRRKKIDMLICQLKPSYLYTLQQYNKAVMQRNSVLKGIRKRENSRQNLDVWNNILVDNAIKIVKERKKYIEEISKIAYEKHLSISDEKEPLEIRYAPSIDTEDSSIFIKELNKIYDEEVQRGSSLLGPHRDDIDFRIDNKEIKKYASQGQQRSAVLSYKLSEIEIIKRETGRNPIFLLDDVMSELDENRRNIMMEECKNLQSFITCTEKEVLSDFDNASFQEIKEGKLKKV